MARHPIARFRFACGFLLFLLAGCNSHTYQLIPKSASWEVAPPIPEPSIPMPLGTDWHLTAGFDRASSFHSGFRVTSSGQSLVQQEFPLLVDSNAFFGSIGFQYTEIDPIPASLHLRLSRWNSAWCGELGATFRSDGLAIQPSVGLEVIESNYLTIDSVVTITDPDEGMEPAISIDKANRKTGTPLSLAPMASLVIAKTEGKILPWMALTVEYRNSLSSSHPDQSSVGSSETVGYSASGSLAQVIGGLRYRPIAPLILATKVGFSSGLGAFRRTSFQTGASLTFTY